MSIKLMTLAWQAALPHADKLVLLALADNANDEGLCWPSVATLEAKCCLDDRTIQRAVGRLITAGHVTVNQRPGRSSYYTVHPRHGDAPVIVTPPSGRHHTPVTVTPHPRHGDGQNHQGTLKEPSLGEVRAARAERASRLPADFQLTPEMIAFAESEQVNARREFEKFTDYWHSASGANARKHDWTKAWKNWCRRASETPGGKAQTQPDLSRWQPPPDDEEPHVQHRS